MIPTKIAEVIGRFAADRKLYLVADGSSVIEPVTLEEYEQRSKSPGFARTHLAFMSAGDACRYVEASNAARASKN